MIEASGTLNVNEATLIVAVQEYLDRRLTEDARVKVCAVKATDTYSGKFEISMEEAPSAQQAPA